MRLFIVPSIYIYAIEYVIRRDKFIRQVVEAAAARDDLTWNMGVESQQQQQRRNNNGMNLYSVSEAVC